MSHYAKVLNGPVIQVIAAEPEFFDTFVDSSPGTWLQTSYNTRGNAHPEGRPMRGNFASVGYTYDRTHDVFYAPRPYASWILNTDTWTWEAPVPMPSNDRPYQWNESTTTWIE